MLPTFSLVLDTRRIKNNSCFPIKLRVTYARKPQYYLTLLQLSKGDFAKLKATRLNTELQKTRDILKDIETKAISVARSLKTFSFSEFEKEFVLNNPLFKQKKSAIRLTENSIEEFDYSAFEKKFAILLEQGLHETSVFRIYLTIIKSLIREGRISTAVYYHCSYVSLKKFRGDVSFEQITKHYLSQYEAWALEKGCSKTTLGMYLRPLRTVFNEAIELEIIKKEKSYPFGIRKYRIPGSKNTKKSLTLNELKLIYYYQPGKHNLREQRAKDFWLFSYFANGMNPKDIALLKYRDLQEGYIAFERSKTQRKLKEDPKVITVFITDELQSIIEKWGTKEKAPDNYVFPILQKDQTPLVQYNTIQLFVRSINDWMKEILKNLGINKKATTYVARHTFSTVLKRAGASTEYIQEALGHSDIKTTESYLDSFEKEVKMDFAKKLTAFKEN